MKRRVLSVMLAAALCLGLLPGRAEAADGLPDTFYLSIGGAVIQSGGSGQADLKGCLLFFHSSAPRGGGSGGLRGGGGVF